MSAPHVAMHSPSDVPAPRRSALFNHPEDVHCVVFDLTLKAAYALAFVFWLRFDDIPPLATTGATGKTFFALGAALLLGWCSGVNVGVNFHNHAHRRVFRSEFLNRWFGRFWTISGGWPAYLWAHSHVVIHHAHLLDPKDDWTLMRRDRNGRFENIYRYSLLHWPWRYFAAMARDYSSGKWGPIGRRVLGETLFFLAVFSIPFFIDWRMGLALWLFPAWLANVMVMGPGMYAQHADCERKSAARPHGHSNVFLSKLFNLSMFNIGYHAEHHDHPMVHWSELPRLHEMMKADLIASRTHVVPFGYYRAGQLLCRATFSEKAATAWATQHPDYLPGPRIGESASTPAPPVPAPPVATAPTSEAPRAASRRVRA